jgi:hypothetical protein
MDLSRAKSPTRTPAYFFTTFHTGYTTTNARDYLNCNAVRIVLTALGFLRLMALTISVVSKMPDLVMPVKDGNTTSDG